MIHLVDFAREQPPTCQRTTLFSDENECSDPNKCRNGVCQNFHGGYQCLCDSGFVVTEDMKACIGQYHTVMYVPVNRLIPGMESSNAQ